MIENTDPVALRTNQVNGGVFAPIFFLINSRPSLPTFQNILSGFSTLATPILIQL